LKHFSCFLAVGIFFVLASGAQARASDNGANSSDWQVLVTWRP
jgi:hypothetical protein